VLDQPDLTPGAAGTGRIASLDRLAALADGLPESLPIDAAAAFVGRSLHVVGADVGFVAMAAADAETIEVRRVTRYSHNPVRLTFPVDARYPLAETMRTQQPLFIADNEDLVCNHPGLVRVNADDHACATVPLLDRDRVVGAINIAYEDPHDFTDEERELVAAVGRYCTGLLTAS
jgi:GAF domain-containing protein